MTSIRKYPEHNRVGLFRKLRTDQPLIQHYAGGYPYKRGNVIVRSSILEPIYSFGMNYKKYGIDFSLFIWTTESDIAKITKFFQSVVKKLKKEDIKDFEGSSDRYVYLELEYGEK